MNEISELNKFSKNYFRVRNENGDYNPFSLRSHQYNLLNRINNGGSYIVSKAREMGLTTTYLVYSMWKILHNSDYNVLIISPTVEQQRYIVDTLFRLISSSSLSKDYNNIQRDKTGVRFGNSMLVVTNESQLSTPVRSYNSSGRFFDLIITEETSYMKDIRLILSLVASIKKTDSTTCISSSVYYDKKGWFYKLFMRAIRCESTSIPIQLDWKADKSKDEVWRRRMNDILGEENAKLQYDGFL